jgi:S1-C subfamily serine protease
MIDSLRCFGLSANDFVVRISDRRAWPRGRRGDDVKTTTSATGGRQLFRGRVKRVHFVGIGGIGMSGIAEVILALGLEVHGSDLKASDVILTVDGKKVTTSQQLKNEVRSKKIGQSVTLDVYRMVDGSHGKTIKIKMNTAAMPDQLTVVASKPARVQEEQTRSLGLTVKSLTNELADQYGVEKAEGVIVTEVESGSAAEGKGIRAGDIITEVNMKAVNTPKQFRDAVKLADLKKGVIINFTSRGTSKFEFLKESGE